MKFGKHIGAVCPQGPVVFVCLAFELWEVAQQSPVITGDFRSPMDLFQNLLARSLRKPHTLNYVLKKVIGWNFLKKDSSVSYREAGRLRPF